MLVFPTRLFAPVSLRARLIGGTVSGGASTGGVAQYGEMSGGGVWSIEFGEANLWSREKFLAWQALEAALGNGSTPIVVPLWDRKHQPTNPKLTTVPFSDLTLWDDSVAWDQATVAATVTSPAALRANQLAFTLTSPKHLVGGEHFSVLHAGNKGWRLYRVTQVVSGGVGSGDATVIKFQPPLRAPVATDTPLNFDTPRCVCRVNGDIGALLEMLRFGKGSASFVETFPATLP